MRVLGLNMPLIRTGDDPVALILKAVGQIGGLRDGDIVVVASKALATAQARLVKLADVEPSKRAKQLASKTKLKPAFVELVLREADEILCTTEGAILTIRDGILCANAGIDNSNAPPGYAVLPLADPNGDAARIRKSLVEQAKVKIGVIIADSNVKPLRLGTVGQAVGFAGIEPVDDCRGKSDIYGKKLQITFRAVADQLATSAELVMGEADELMPVVVVRGAKVELTDAPKTSPKVSPKKCLYLGVMKVKR